MRERECEKAPDLDRAQKTLMDNPRECREDATTTKKIKKRSSERHLFNNFWKKFGDILATCPRYHSDDGGSDDAADYDVDGAGDDEGDMPGGGDSPVDGDDDVDVDDAYDFNGDADGHDKYCTDEDGGIW
eukprot:6576440-Pyramimonas_sp.AAC.2